MKYCAFMLPDPETPPSLAPAETVLLPTQGPADSIIDRLMALGANGYDDVPPELGRAVSAVFQRRLAGELRKAIEAAGDDRHSDAA